MKLAELLDLTELQRCLDERLVVARAHPTLPYIILNYTERCQYEVGHWNDITRKCRGLIYNAETGDVLARPYSKFFNYGEQSAPALDLNAEVFVTDKMDGSMGILYPTPDGPAIATRGSFTSDQAIHATQLLRTKYPHFCPQPDFTYLFEIIYPENRIVVNYGMLDDLVFLGTVHTRSGLSSQWSNWDGPATQRFGQMKLVDALALPPRENAEGIVIHVLATDDRLKVKQEDYVELHRIVTGLNPRRVWEHLGTGEPLAALLEKVPDEFHAWLTGLAVDMFRDLDNHVQNVEQQYAQIDLALGEGYSRKDFAARAVQSPYRGELFMMYDKKDYRSALWRRVEPKQDENPRILERTL